MMCGKVGSLKRRARSTFPSQNAQKTPFSTFGRSDAEKMLAIEARSTFRSQKMKKRKQGSGLFWRFQSKCAKGAMFGPLLEDQMRKKCAALWRKARFQGKMDKTHHVRTTFGSSDVEKVHAFVARSTFPVR